MDKVIAYLESKLSDVERARYEGWNSFDEDLAWRMEGIDWDRELIEALQKAVGIKYAVRRLEHQDKSIKAVRDGLIELGIIQKVNYTDLASKGEVTYLADRLGVEL